MRRNSRLRSLALAAAMSLAMQTIGAPVAYAEEDVQELLLPEDTEISDEQDEDKLAEESPEEKTDEEIQNIEDNAEPENQQNDVTDIEQDETENTDNNQNDEVEEKDSTEDKNADDTEISTPTEASDEDESVSDQKIVIEKNAEEDTDEEIVDEEAAKEYLEKALEGIEIPSADAIRGNITLNDKAGKAELSWESSNEAVISSKSKVQDGYYDIPAGVVTRGSSDEKVTLTVTASLSGVELSKDIEVTVLANKAKDENYKGYLYAHFKEIPGQKGEQDIFYGISEDGLNWTALNGNEAVLKSDVSDEATRDPYIIRSAEGDKFYLLATDQNIYKYGDSIPWDKLSTQGSTALTIWESTDLINWTNERNVDVAGSIDGGCAWAPEAIYDEATGEYLVYWASKIAADNFARQYTFVSRTRDFYNFTEPELFNDFGSNIDTSMLKVGDDYYRLTKMEDGMYVRLDKASGKLRSYGSEVTTKTIGSRTFNVVGNNYSYIANTADGCLESFKGNYEGGTMFKFNDRDEWCVMLDEYGGAARGYIPFTTTDLSSQNSIHVLGEDEYTPQEGCKHGVIIPVTASEYDNLIKTYGVEDGLLASMGRQDDPVAEYDFENADGQKVLANGADLGLTLNGSAELKSDSEGGKALYLDGSDGSFAKFSDGVFDAMDELTISLDVNAKYTDAAGMVVALGSDADKYLYMRVNDVGQKRCGGKS
ncbi:glycoside hydrolase family 43 protein [Butyrivibrio sp. XPD2002]|uniref:glycoside hydrolase family 43 protein n=1 Tax=Butyrivibrio sp. XPD2002 TaxID=1280665 RepID=UPI0004004925|nr:glycoside hydrolase family 43 protein [Butyrivibrio sp. XPD2002]